MRVYLVFNEPHKRYDIARLIAFVDARWYLVQYFVEYVVDPVYKEMLAGLFE